MLLGLALGKVIFPITLPLGKGPAMAAMHKLSARGVATITAPGRHSDGGNLYLSVTKAGSRSWLFLFRMHGKQREMGLGPAGEGGVTLADARAAAANARKLLHQGIDPIEARAADRKRAKDAAAGEMSFGSYADAYLALHEAEWKNPKHRAQWRATLGDTYIRDLRKRPVASVDTDDVLAVIRPIWNTKRETANRIRQRVERILDAAMVEGKRPKGLNPARWKGHLSLLLPAHGRASKGHFKAMPWRDLPGFMKRLDEADGIAARALELLILTACRSGEVRGARWSEIDLDAKVWTIPAERMKAGREHRVPLGDRSVAVVEGMIPLRPRRDSADALVFPGLRKAPLSDMTLSAVLRRMKIDNATVHGFRSAFRDWGGEATSATFEVLEASLAHSVGSETVRAYARSDLFEKRRALLDQWAAFLDGDQGAQVVPIGARK